MVDVIVEFAYDAEQPDELTIKVGDVITNVTMDAGGWWEGELNSKKGMFPDNFVKVIKKEEKEVKKEEVKKKEVQASKRQSVRDLANKIKDSVHDGPVPFRKKDPNAKKKRAKVVFAYDPENDDELKLAVGDSVDVLKQEEEGWWEGTVNGKTGMFPSNFVEIEDAESGDNAEKSEVAAEPDNQIKGKKVQGIGLGNIFGDGPIKLRSTSNKKPGDKPQEPPKTEKRTPESPVQRRAKDASAYVTNPPDPPNTSLGMSGLSDDGASGTDEEVEEAMVYLDSEAYCINASDILEKHPNFMEEVEYIDELGCGIYKIDVHEPREEDLIEYADVDIIPGEFQSSDEETCLQTKVRIYCKTVAPDGEETDTNNNLSETNIEQFGDSGNVGSKTTSLKQVTGEDSGDFSESLFTILDDLDICLDQSYDNTHSYQAGKSRQVGICTSESKDGNDTRLPGYLLNTSGDVLSLPLSHLKSPREGKEIKQFPSLKGWNQIQQTPPSHPNFSQAIDSVLVMKKRFTDSAEKAFDLTPLRHQSHTSHFQNESITKVLNYDKDDKPRSVFTPVADASDTSALVAQPLSSNSTDPLLPKSTNTYFASLNKSGSLSPFIRSIANKYQLFTPSRSHFRQLDLGWEYQHEDDMDSYTTSMISHTVDVQMSVHPDNMESNMDTSELNFNDEPVEPLSSDMNSMVNNYVYEVLSSRTMCKGNNDLTKPPLQKQSSDLERMQGANIAADNESLAVCVDENSIRMLDTSSKDGTDEPEYDDKDSITLELDYMGGVLLSMTEGDDQSPPLSSCSPSMYPCRIQSTPYRQTDVEPPDVYPPQCDIHEEQRNCVSEIAVETQTDCLHGLHQISKQSLRSALALPDSGYLRQTSSFCRIPFSSDAPSFWFRKDFNESPRPKSDPVLEIRSPKRSLSQVVETVPSLFELAKRVFYDEFNLNIKTSHGEFEYDSVLNSVNTGTESFAFFNDRSPAKKKRKKNVDGSHLNQLSTKVTVNLNANALPKSGLEDNSILELTNTDNWGGVDTYFASKIDSPPKGERELVASPASTNLQNILSCTQMSSGPKTDWAEKLFGQNRKSKSSGRVHDNEMLFSNNMLDTTGDSIQNDEDDELNVNPLRYIAKPVHYGISFSGTIESAADFADSCSEKRRKRLFVSKFRKAQHENPVQLTSFRSLHGNPRRNIEKELVNPDKAEKVETSFVDESEIHRKHLPGGDVSYNLENKEMSELKHADVSVFVSPVKSREEIAPFPEHVIEDLRHQIAQDGTNTVCSYLSKSRKELYDNSPVQLTSFSRLHDKPNLIYSNPRRNIKKDLVKSDKIEKVETSFVDESEIHIEYVGKYLPGGDVSYNLENNKASELKHHDLSVFVSPVKSREESAPLPEHVIEDLRHQIAQDDTNTVSYYFDHGDEPASKKVLRPVTHIQKSNPKKGKSTLNDKNVSVQFYVGDDTSNTVSCFFGGDDMYFTPVKGTTLDEDKDDMFNNPGSKMTQTVASLKKAVLRHIEATEGVTMAEADVMAMMQTRCEMYGAASETVNSCSDGELEDLKSVDSEPDLSGHLSRDDDLNCRIQRGQNGYDVTPDPDTLVNDLQGLDLSGTPQYASTQGADGEMKEFLKEALESLDNILIESFTSATDSPTKDDTSYLNTSKDDAEKGVENEDTLEIKDDSVLNVVGTKCVMHEKREAPTDYIDIVVLEDRALERDFSNEFKGDSILNIGGTQSEILVLDQADASSSKDSTSFHLEDKHIVNAKCQDVGVLVLEGSVRNLGHDESFDLNSGSGKNLAHDASFDLNSDNEDEGKLSDPHLMTSSDTECQGGSTCPKHFINPLDLAANTMLPPAELDTFEYLDEENDNEACSASSSRRQVNGNQERQPLYMCFSPMIGYYTTQSTLQQDGLELQEPMYESSPVTGEVQDEYSLDYYCTTDVLQESLSLIMTTEEEEDEVEAPVDDSMDNCCGPMDSAEPVNSELNRSFCIEEDESNNYSRDDDLSANQNTNSDAEDTLGLSLDTDDAESVVRTSMGGDVDIRSGKGYRNIWGKRYCVGGGNGDGCERGGIDDLDVRIEDDRHWLEEHVQASCASTDRPDSEAREASVMSECPSQFKEKISTYPSPDVSSDVFLSFCQSGDTSLM